MLGVEFFVGDLEAAATAVVARARAGLGGYACLTGVHGTVLAQHDMRVRLALASAWRNFADGAPIAWVQRRTGHEAARRVAGPDLMPLVIEQGIEHGLRHFFFGSTDAVLADLRARVIARVPGAEIVGVLSPPFSDEVEPEAEHILDEVRRTAPDVVWIGLGTPKQDLWMLSNAHQLEPALVMGVGAAFDFNVGRLRRAPLWMQRSGLEWLHRAAKEPRLRGRYLRVNGDFVVRALVQVSRERLRFARRGER